MIIPVHQYTSIVVLPFVKPKKATRLAPLLTNRYREPQYTSTPVHQYQYQYPVSSIAVLVSFNRYRELTDRLDDLVIRYPGVAGYLGGTVLNCITSFQRTKCKLTSGEFKKLLMKLPAYRSGPMHWARIGCIK